MQRERDELYSKFTAAILEVQQKTGFKNLFLERKLQALSAAMEKKELQLNEVLAASNLDPATLTLVSRKLEVSARWAPGAAGRCPCSSLAGGLQGLWRRVTCLMLRPQARAASTIPVNYCGQPWGGAPTRSLTRNSAPCYRLGWVQPRLFWNWRV